VIKSEGIAPSQYGTKGMAGDKLTEMEEKYDLKAIPEGFGTLGAEGAAVSDEEDEDLGLGEEAEEEEGGQKDEEV
jgi:hypothetical protein